MPNSPRGENVNFSLVFLTVALVAVLYLAVQGAGTLAMMIVGGVGIVVAWVLPFFGGGRGDEEPVEFRITAPDSDSDEDEPSSAAAPTGSTAASADPERQRAQIEGEL